MMYKSFLKLLILLTLFNCAVLEKTNAQEPLDKARIKASMIKALEWQEAHPIFALAPTDWTAGAYYVGVSRAHKTTKNQIYEAALKNQGYWNNWNTLDRYFHADDVAISYSYLYIEMNLGRRNFVDLKPTEAFLDEHLFGSNKWKDGTDSDETKNILWWWCDALFMAPPVITLYTKYSNQEKYLDAMHGFYKETYDQLYDKEERLFARDLRFVWTGKKDRKEPNGKKIFWSRGNGWVLAGLALILEDLPEDDAHRSFYETLYKEMASRILELQPNDGLWRTSLLCPESYDHGEVSGSGFYTFALAWGINNGLLDKTKYRPAVIKAWNALSACQKEDGMIGWVQNIGAFPEPATADSWQNFGTGAYLLAGSEVLKL